MVFAELLMSQVPLIPPSQAIELSILEMVTVTRLLSTSSAIVPTVRGDVTRTKEPAPLRAPLYWRMVKVPGVRAVPRRFTETVPLRARLPATFIGATDGAPKEPVSICSVEAEPRVRLLMFSEAPALATRTARAELSATE